MTAKTSSAMNAGDTYRGPPRLASFGELLWDIYPSGPKIGGAPANVAYHAKLLGADSTLITRVGADSLGTLAKKFLTTRGVRVLAEPPSRYPTGRVMVNVEGDGVHYSIEQPAAYDEIGCTTPAREAARASDVMVFGTLARRAPASRAALSHLLVPERDGSRPQLAVDLNLREPFSTRESITFCLEKANVLKLNDEELEVVKGILASQAPIPILLERFGISLILVTHGANGATLYSRHLTIKQHGFPSSGRDPVGAGDAFFAGFLVNLRLGESLPACLERAARYGALVAGLDGAMPTLSAREVTRVLPPVRHRAKHWCG